MRAALAVAAALLGCGKSREAPPSADADGLHQVRGFDGDIVLLHGQRSFAVTEGSTWYRPTGKDVQRVSQPLVDQVCEADFEAFLGHSAIVMCGEEHHERVFRLAMTAKQVEIPGTLQRVEAFTSGPEVWLYQDRLAPRLALVDGTRVTPLPIFTRTLPIPDDSSPVHKKACEAPNIVDLASSDELVAALVTECHPEAAVRVETYRWPGPARNTNTLAPANKLGFQPYQLAIGPNGAIAIAGIADGKLATLRPGGTVELGPGPASQVIELVAADDGALWVLTLGTRGVASEWILTRDRAVVPLPSGMHAEGLALDAELGVVVKVTGNGRSWIYAERGPMP